MNLEPAPQGEVSQKGKNEYHILMHIYEIKKNGTVEPICRAGIEMPMWIIDLWTQRGEVKVGQIVRVALKYIHCHVQNK